MYFVTLAAEHKLSSALASFDVDDDDDE